MIPRLVLAISLALCSTAAVAEEKSCTPVSCVGAQGTVSGMEQIPGFPGYGPIASGTGKVHSDGQRMISIYDDVCTEGHQWTLSGPPPTVVAQCINGKWQAVYPKSTPHPDAKPLPPDGLKDVPDGMYAVDGDLYWRIPSPDSIRCYSKRGPAITEISCPKEVK